MLLRFLLLFGQPEMLQKDIRGSLDYRFAGQSKTYVQWSTSSTYLVLTFNNVIICLCYGEMTKEKVT